MNRSIIYILSILCVLLSSCKKEQFGLRPYPRLRTLPVSNLTDSTAIFNAEVILDGEHEILEYGFVWSKQANPTIEKDFVNILDNSLSTSKFFLPITEYWVPLDQYYVRSFLRTDQYFIYGSEVNFQYVSNVPLAKLDRIYPDEGTWGDTLFVEGSNFSIDTSENQAFLGEVQLMALSASENILSFQIPPIANTASFIPFKLTVRRKPSFLYNKFSYIRPYIFSASPRWIHPGKTLEISGKNIHVDYTEVYLDRKLVPITTISEELITITIPREQPPGRAGLMVKSAGFTKNLSINIR